MYRLTDQVRDLAVGYADVHVQQRSRPRALCEFDGTKWSPVELIDETQLNSLQPALRRLSVFPNGPHLERDSAYASTAGSSVGRHSPNLSVGSYQSFDKDESHQMTQQIHQERSPIVQQANIVRRSSSFRLPTGIDLEEYSPAEDDQILEQDEDEGADEESDDILRDMIVQQKTGPSGVARRPSILASPNYQRKLASFADLQVSEVDLTEEDSPCDMAAARQHVINAFPKQFAAEAKSAKPLTSFTLYSRAEDYVEMLHVVLVLETREVFWKLTGPSNKKMDRVTSLPYCWEADLDLPPLSLDEPSVTNEVECLIMGRPTYSTIMCDNHNDECRKCKGLASQDDCFACDGSGIFKKKPCVMCSGNGQYFCTHCRNTGKMTCKTCQNSNGPRPILRQAYVRCTRETVVSQTMEVESDNKATLIRTAKALAKRTIEAENFGDKTLPVAACGVVIRQRGHIVCATDYQTGARGLFEVVQELDRVTFKGQLAPINIKQDRPGTANSSHSHRSTASKSGSNSDRSSWFGRKKEDEGDEDNSDTASIRSTASSRMRNFFRRG